MNNNRTFGVEIEFVGDRDIVAWEINATGLRCEIESYNHCTRPHWKIVSDSSVHATGRQSGSGWELVSPILKGQDGLEQIKKVCQAMKQAGAAVNVTCGLHVHHDARDFNVDTFKNIVKIYARFETTIDTLVAPSRRGNENTYCQTLQGVDMDRLLKQTNINGIRNIYGGRYHKLNLDSYITHGTVEFRQHQGTIDADKIINWIKLTQAMVQRAVDRPVRKGTAADWGTFKDYIFRNHAPNNRQTTFSEDTKQLVKFYQKRRQELAAA
jgi:hypothetical protein